MGSNYVTNEQWLQEVLSPGSTAVSGGSNVRLAPVLPFAGQPGSNVQRITLPEARGYRFSDEEVGRPSYAASILDELKRPRGDITTLLDIANRDTQDDDLFPLNTNLTWFTRSQERKLLPFTPLIQEIPFRGPAAFGQRFSFDIGSLLTGDYLFGAALQIHLSHWLDQRTQNMLAAGKFTYADPATGWEYANSLGSAIIAQAELEIDGDTIELIDGDFINVSSLLFQDYNSQFGVAYDSLGRISLQRLVGLPQPRLFTVEGGILHCVLPFFFMRTKYQDALPMSSIREGLVRIHVTLRPFAECVRQLRGFRDTCESTPLQQSFTFLSTVPPSTQTATTGAAEPELAQVRLVTYGALTNGPQRQKLVRQPHEIIHREVQTFFFDEPLKYVTAKRADSDTIRVSLPLEANHPLEEIVWFVRRKGVRENNAWTNYTSVLEREWGSNGPRKAAVPLLRAAAIQANGVTLCEAEEEYYRQLIAQHHKGGAAAYGAFVYGYPFARRPGEHQPSGTLNASRLNSLRLVLDVKPPGGVLDAAWEVKVFCIGLNWMRFEHGLANPMFNS